MLDNNTQWIINDNSRLSIKQMLLELWVYRYLTLLLAKRAITYRSKQSFLGLLWPVFNPIVSSLLYLFVFNKLAGFDGDGAPYIFITFIGATVWGYIRTTVTAGTGTLVANTDVVVNTYFPRIVFPSSVCISSLLGLGIGSILLTLLSLAYQIPILSNLVMIPLLLGSLVLTALGLAILLSALNTRYRDVAQGTQYFVQLWMWISPVAYPSSVIPEKWVLLYYLNPLAGILDGFRWAILGTNFRDEAYISFFVAGCVFYAGLIIFGKLERTMADHL